MRRPTLPMIPLWLSIGIAVVLRMLLIGVISYRGHPPGFVVPDSPGYLELANSLARRGEFATAAGVPEFFRTPGYPALLSVGVVEGLPGFVTVQFALAMQLVLSATIVALVYLLAKLCFARQQAGLCALIAAVEPTMTAWSLRVMPETVLTFCLVVFAYCALRALAASGPGWIVAAAASLAAAAYVKPIAWPLILVVAMLAFVVRQVGRRRATIFLVISVLLLLPWHVRNYRRVGHAGFSSVMERSVFFGAAASVIAHQEGRGLRAVQADLIKQEGTSVNSASQLRRGFALVAARPDVVLGNHVVGTMRTLFDPGATEYLRFLGLYTQGGRAALADGGVAAAARAYPLPFWSSVVLAAVLAPLVLLGLAGIFRTWRTREVSLAVLGVIVLYLTLVSGGSPGTGRMRVPMVPFLILLSTYAVTGLRTHVEPQKEAA